MRIALSAFFASLILITALLAGCSEDVSDTGSSIVSISSPKTTPTNTLPAALPSSVNNGVVLSAWMWSFEDITANIGKIAAAGYTAVQTSPVQPLKSKPTISSWWLMYQPCDLTVGNNALGNKAEFQALTAAADSAGVKIIVDAVLNHVADDGTVGGIDSSVASYIKAKKNDWFHNLGKVDDIGGWSNRYAVTQGSLGNGPDWKTQDATVQGMMRDFLNACIADGADGFRFDAAKSIETSQGGDAGQAWNGVSGSGNFWDNVLPALTNKANLFLYGEVLQDNPGDNEAGYQTYFRTTSTGVLWQVSNAIDNQNLTGLTYLSKSAGGNQDTSKVVVYCESWDNYRDEVGLHTSSFSYNKRLLSNAILSARAGMVNVVFVRPGEKLWWDPTMVAVNRFRNLMANQGANNEWLVFNTNNGGTTLPNSILGIRRQNGGIDKGIVIVNAGPQAAVSVQTNLSGTFTDRGPSGNTFNANGSYISGTVPANTAVILVP